MTEKDWELKSNDFNKKVLEIFPKFEFSNSGWSTVNDTNASGTYEYRLNQRSLSDTVYLNSLGKEFIHYTSVSNLCNILNEDSIRMYNLIHKNDPREFDYLIKKYKLQIDEEEINLFKRSFHLFSMCKYDEVEKDNFNMWRNYGKDGHGIGIVFELLNDNWDYFLLGETQYEEDELSEHRICKIINIYNEYREFINRNRIPILFGSLFLYHKNKIWKDEREVRIFTYLSYNEHSLTFNNELSELNHQYLKFFFDSGKVGSYVSLPLENNLKLLAEKSGLENYNFFPRLRVKKVVIGYRISNEEMHRLRHVILHYNRMNHQNIVFEESMFYKDFN